MDPLSLSVGIIATLESGVDISKRILSLPDVVDSRDLRIQVERTNSLLHQLPELLQTLEGPSAIAPDSFQETLANYHAEFRELRDISKFSRTPISFGIRKTFATEQ